MTKDEEQEFVHYLVIPKEIVRKVEARDISWTEAVLMSLIKNLSNDERPCYASNRYLSKRMALSIDHLRTSIRNLITLGLVLRTTDEEGRRYLSVTESITYAEPPGNDCPGPGLWITRPRVMDNPHKVKLNNNTKIPKVEDGKMVTGFNGQPVDTAAGRGVPKTKRPNPFDRLCAANLLYAINPRKKHPSSTLIKEAHHFRLLREVDHIETEDIEEVLTYHCRHLRDQYQPTAISGKEFRTKWPKLLAAYRRAHPKELELEISPACKQIVERLRMNRWPKGSGDQLEAEVQQALNAAKAFHDGMRQFRDMMPSTQRLENGSVKYIKPGVAIRHLLQCWPSNHLVESHYEQVFHRIRTWDAWSGDMGMFRLDEKFFEQWVYKELQQHGGDNYAQSLTGKLMDEIYQA